MLKIDFDKEIYKPGDEVKAFISLNLPYDTRIRYGKLKIFYIQTAKEGGKITFSRPIYEKEIEFMEEGRYVKGVYNYDINFSIPSEAPPTYRGKTLDCLLYYVCSVLTRDGYEYSKRGELKISISPKEKPKEKIFSIGSGKIHINLVIPDPLIGKHLIGILSIETGIELIRRIGIDICFYEGYKVEKLIFFKGFKEITRCIPLYNITVTKEEYRYPIRIDLSNVFRGRHVYTAPYENEEISYKPYLRFRVSTREGIRTYHIPIKWYPYEEREIGHSLEKAVYTLEERARIYTLKYFEEYGEGDIIDIQKFLLMHGININIYSLEKILEELVEDEIIIVMDNNPILKKYKVNLG